MSFEPFFHFGKDCIRDCLFLDGETGTDPYFDEAMVGSPHKEQSIFARHRQTVPNTIYKLNGSLDLFKIAVSMFR